jgi:hypothetical protein
MTTEAFKTGTVAGLLAPFGAARQSERGTGAVLPSSSMHEPASALEYGRRPIGEASPSLIDACFRASAVTSGMTWTERRADVAGNGRQL